MPSKALFCSFSPAMLRLAQGLTVSTDRSVHLQEKGSALATRWKRFTSPAGGYFNTVNLDTMSRMSLKTKSRGLYRYSKGSRRACLLPASTIPGQGLAYSTPEISRSGTVKLLDERQYHIGFTNYLLMIIFAESNVLLRVKYFSENYSLPKWSSLAFALVFFGISAFGHLSFQF